VPLLAPLDADQRTTFLVVTLAPKALRKLVGKLGTAPSGTRLDTLSPWDLAWSLVDYYETDGDVSDAVDHVLKKEIGTSPLAGSVAADGAPEAMTQLVLEATDPLRDLAWALLARGGEAAGPLAARLVQTIIAEFDDADARAREEEERAEPEEPAAPAPVDEIVKDATKEAARARTARKRALQRVGRLKQQVTEIGKGLEDARKEQRQAEQARALLQSERDRAVAERDALRAQVQSGTAAEVARLTAEVETAIRRQRGIESERDEAQAAEAALRARLRALEDERPQRAAAPQGHDGADTERPTAVWALPVFTEEFYDSIRRWDRRIIRNAFEKIARLADDWRHPSLRAIPLEGLPGCYRIRIATDVRLIYRLLDGNRVEILSLIDREDLQRYIRMAK
jgi:mRNA-degrading endonuclease RelE of RelBE toxin-antitoxin system